MTEALAASHYAAAIPALLGMSVCLFLLWTWAYHRASGYQLPDRLILSCGLSCSFIFLLVITSRVLEAPSLPWNEERLVPALAMVKGYRVYRDPATGPWLSTAYGPLTYIIYLPLALLRSPTVVLMAGAAFAQVLYFFPVLLLIWQHYSRTLSRRPLHYLIILFFLAATFDSPALSESSAYIHADAPALCFAALGCILIRFFECDKTSTLLLSALCLTLSVSFKQNMFPACVAVPAYLLIVKRQFFTRYVFCLCLGGFTVLAALAIWLRPFSAFFFNVAVVPRHHPYFLRSLLPAAKELYREARDPLLALCFLVACGCLFLPQGFRSFRQVLSRERSLLFAWVGAFLVPTTILGRIKAGGGANSLSPSVYFFLIAVLVALLDRTAALDRTAQAFRSLGTLLGIAYVGIVSLFILPETLNRLMQEASLWQNPAHLVYRYCNKHPGQTYFPMNPLAVLLAENRVYHSHSGIFDKTAAGYTISPEELERWLPPCVKYVAFPPHAWPAAIARVSRLVPLGPRVTDPELPGFLVYRAQPFPSGQTTAQGRQAAYSRGQVQVPTILAFQQRAP
jgi:hypothetical protein